PSPASSPACNARALSKSAAAQHSTTRFPSEVIMIDLNHGSQATYSAPPVPSVADRINGLIDSALVDRNRRQAPRDYLGGSRIGEPCARKLVYEYAHAEVDAGKEFDGRTLRIFAAGHQFETLSIRWLRAAGFDLR